jgi:uncharacterized protein (TIGR02646 family)
VRYIDTHKLKQIIPPDLLKDLEQATAKLFSLPEEKRASFIKTHARLWSRVKPYLVQLTEGKHSEDYKCWYCEAKDIRSKYEVDHFRPKNQVRNKGCLPEPGYWWLAFEPANYRLSCSLCNTPKGKGLKAAGKWDQFPLKENSPRARTPEENVNDEICLLLDPAKPTDPSLIDFGADGRAYPRYPKGTFFYQKANISIEVLNLNDIRIQEARKQIRQKCLETVEEGDRVYHHFYTTGSPSAEASFEKICAEILEMVSPYSEFSAMALCYFFGSNSDWVLDLLSPHLPKLGIRGQDREEKLEKAG